MHTIHLSLEQISIDSALDVKVTVSRDFSGYFQLTHLGLG